MTTDKETIIAALRAWVRQRPGLEPGNYISDWRDAEGRSAYRSESRAITQQRHDAEYLLALASSPLVTAEHLAEQLTRGGRLTWNGERLDYCAGQYWCTEYRAAACRAVSSALWYAWRDEYLAAHGTTDGAGEYVRRQACAMFPRGVVRRWFN